MVNAAVVGRFRSDEWSEDTGSELPDIAGKETPGERPAAERAGRPDHGVEEIMPTKCERADEKKQPDKKAERKRRKRRTQYNQAAGLSFGQNDDTDIASHAVVATCIDGIAEIPF